MERRIKQLIRDFELDRHVIMVGNLSNPFALMAKARALLLTSTHESFSLVLIEAMASGTAVISVDFTARKTFWKAGNLACWCR